MNPSELKALLESVSSGRFGIDDAVKKLSELPFADIGHTSIDYHRELRNGFPEVIYCSGKTSQQVADIVENMSNRRVNVLGTRATKYHFDAAAKVCPELVWSEISKTIRARFTEPEKREGFVAIVTAGTSDMSVAEEAATTLEEFGNDVRRYFDKGVAGIHRLLPKIIELREARAVIAVAGMEGALPSVIGGLVSCPVIAVPTSTGYGVGAGGYAALFAMLSSCTSGVSVVNIDNGFGAACAAHRIGSK